MGSHICVAVRCHRSGEDGMLTPGEPTLGVQNGVDRKPLSRIRVTAPERAVDDRLPTGAQLCQAPQHPHGALRPLMVAPLESHQTADTCFKVPAYLWRSEILPPQPLLPPPARHTGTYTEDS